MTFLDLICFFWPYLFFRRYFILGTIFFRVLFFSGCYFFQGSFFSEVIFFQGYFFSELNFFRGKISEHKVKRVQKIFQMFLRQRSTKFKKNFRQNFHKSFPKFNFLTRVLSFFQSRIVWVKIISGINTVLMMT